MRHFSYPPQVANKPSKRSFGKNKMQHQQVHPLQRDASNGNTNKTATPVNKPTHTHRRVNSNPVSTRFRDTYKVLTKIGSGSHAQVFSCEHRATGDMRAVKIFRRSKHSDENAAILNEIEISKSLDHEYVVNIYETYVEEMFIYIVMDLMVDNLFHRVMMKQFYSEEDARSLIQQTLKAMQYLHENNIVHSDIKLDNLLLSEKGEVRLCDFSLAQRMSEEKPLTKRCGTPMYMAPEVARGFPYGSASDMWSLGCAVYLMIAGYPPFMIEKSEPRSRLIRKILNAKFEFYNEEWGHVSEELKDFISQLICLQPTRRLTAEEALKHPWITGEGMEASVPVAIHQCVITKVVEMGSQCAVEVTPQQCC